jgi:HSP20 family protein
MFNRSWLCQDIKKKEEKMKSLVKWNSNGENLMFPEFPSLFDDFLMRDLFSFPSSVGFNNGSVPAVNVKETDSAYELEMAAPGMEKEDFKVELKHDALIISAHRENNTETTSEDGRYSRREFSYRSFRRSFNLPEDQVKADEIGANYKHGILHITVPKKEIARTRNVKQIAVT